jgi:hypothetical protein
VIAPRPEDRSVKREGRDPEADHRSHENPEREGDPNCSADDRSERRPPDRPPERHVPKDRETG